MKKSHIKILILEFVMILGLILNILVFQNFEISNMILIIGWSLILLGLYFLVGIEKDRSLNKIDTIQIVFIYSFIYIILTYFVGIFVGFTKSPYSLQILSILKNILPILILISLQEIFRYTVAVKCQENKLVLVLMLILLMSIDFIFNFKFYNYSTGMDIFEVIGTLILPSIVNHIILTFICLKSGYLPPILYRLLMEGLIYLVPIAPDLNIYLTAILKIVFPTILFLKFNTIYAKNKFNSIERTRLAKWATNLFIIVIVAATVGLVSGAFKYYAMAIGSPSMDPQIKKGDAVMIEKYLKKTKLKEGMIIAYQHDTKVIVHRISKITQKGTLQVITTKGDNNNNADSWEVHQKDILGIVKMKIPWIGWPSIWLSESQLERSK